MKPFTLLIKPTGSDCNLDCKYCFYKNRAPEVGHGRQRMTEEVLEKLIRDYLALGLSPAVFSWQGGEPMLMGLDFYKKAVELQKKYGSPGRKASNSLQTNAVLLDRQWCDFLRENEFLVGISIDGPKEYHDFYRTDRAGNGTFDKVAGAIELCLDRGVEFNALVLLNDRNTAQPDELFDFFLKMRLRYLQFITCVENDPQTGQIAGFSVTAGQYGRFLCRIFDRWIDHGPEKLSIRDFDSILSWCLAGEHTICTFQRLCDSYIVVEHDGSCFCCDFFVRPAYRLGSILEDPIDKLAGGDKKRAFARRKRNLSSKCIVCRYMELCLGGCIKDRVASGSDTGPSYLCEGYRMFFEHSLPRFRQLAADVGSR
jgi:uncharacterized protein